MRIVIIGAGTVGTSIAERLCSQRHGVTVIDHDPAVTRQVNEELDVRTVTGSASQSSVHFQAGVAGADLCLAVTCSDESNLIASSMAKAMGARRTVARVYAPIFRDLSTFDYQRHFGIDRLLSLEHLSAVELARGIRQPGAMAVESFARGELEVQEIHVTEGTSAVGVPLRELKLPKGVRIGSIQRDGKLSLALAADKVALNDRITLIGRRGHVDEVKEVFEARLPPKQGVAIAGGGETGYHLARVLEAGRFGVVVIEADRQRCEYLASHLKYATVVNDDVQRRTVLEEERVGAADIFVACTGEDENNIMACVEAKELGAKSIFSIVSRPDYANVVGKLGINHAVSPREVVAKQVDGFLNSGAVISRAPLSPGASIDILEIEVLEGAPVTEHVLASLKFPPECLIAAVIRDNYVRVPGADDRMAAGDTVVALVGREVATEMLKLFGGEG